VGKTFCGFVQKIVQNQIGNQGVDVGGAAMPSAARLRTALYRLDDWTGNEDSFENLLPDRWVKSLAPPTEAAALVAARVQVAPAIQGFPSAIS
jgi:hypothetical protein